ncbi:MAG: dihydroorotate dehydrogenase electron transfer subunit [Clostridia bacterium]|nr:dihydroorotate dehydrogenase electron transfer subunit [Clostridia bacterium]
MKQQQLTILENQPLAPGVFRMQLQAEEPIPAKPGQFLNLAVEGCYLRRPISVHDADGNIVLIIYKVVGRGTQILSEMTPGQALDALTGLGNGYDLRDSGPAPLLIGGGVGVPPLYLLAKQLRAEGKAVRVILGFNKAEERFCEEEFLALGCEVAVTTVDGSYGMQGFVTAAMDQKPYSCVYACGPEPMLRAVYRACKTGGQFSFEERMGCGFGVCLGCPCKTITGYKRICKDGPVLRKEEILWED